MNEKPCTVCGVPEADHSTDWRAHSYVPPIDDTQREPLSAEGLREVLQGGGTVSELAAKESEGGAASFGAGGASFLDRFNSLVIRAELAVQSFGDLVSKAVKHQTTTTTVPVPATADASADPNTPDVPVATSDLPTTVEHGVNQSLTEVPPSNPE